MEEGETEEMVMEEETRRRRKKRRKGNGGRNRDRGKVEDGGERREVICEHIHGAKQQWTGINHQWPAPSNC